MRELMDVATLRAAMAATNVTDATLADYLPHFTAAMCAADINTENRAAAWCSQIGHESAGLRYMAEIETGNPSWSADRTRYRGRGPIQLTWEANYRKFGQWCKEQGYVTDPELFVKQPELVEQPRWGFLAASWYWLHAGPRPGRINEYADARDILAVSRCVNGWVEGQNPNGYADRCARWNRCLALGDRLLAGEQLTPVKKILTVEGDPTWLEDVLRPALGDRLKTLDGWQDSGVGGEMGKIWGCVWHHTGNSRESAQSIRNGRPDLAGPLAQLHIAPDGTVTIVAVGPCNHAGLGSWAGIGTDNANAVTIGIECAWPDIKPDGSYNASQRWPDAQIISMRDTGAAITKHLGVDVSHNISHKEWAQQGPAGMRQSKWDPGNISMDWFRGEIQKDINGKFDPKPEVPPTPQPIPILPPDYAREVWDQLRTDWPQLGDQTLVNALAQIRDKVCGTTDYADWKAGK